MLNELYTFAEPVQVVPFSNLKWGKFTLLHTYLWLTNFFKLKSSSAKSSLSCLFKTILDFRLSVFGSHFSGATLIAVFCQISTDSSLSLKKRGTSCGFIFFVLLRVINVSFMTTSFASKYRKSFELFAPNLLQNSYHRRNRTQTKCYNESGLLNLLNLIIQCFRCILYKWWSYDKQL